MKLLVTTEIDFSKSTGDVIHLIEEMKNLVKLGNDIVIFAPNFSDNIEIDNLKIILIPIIKIKFISLLIFEVFLFFYILPYSFKNKAEIIYNRCELYSLAAPFLSVILRVPLVCEVNGLKLDELSLTSKPSVKLRLIKYIVAQVYKTNYTISRHIFAVTSFIKEDIIKNYLLKSDRITVVPNGVNTDIFYPIDVVEARQKVNLNRDYSYIVFTGNLVHWQGLEYLIKSAPYIIKQKSDIKFIIVGDGVLKHELINLSRDTGLEDYFQFVGNVKHENVKYYINAANVCLVYKKELKSGYSPLKLYEYMACARPIIASNVKGFDIVEKYNLGIVVEAENSEKLAAAIIDILKNPAKQKIMGENGRKYVMNKNKWEKSAEIIHQVLLGINK